MPKIKREKKYRQRATANVNINIRDYTKRRSPVKKSVYGGFNQNMSQFRNVTAENNSLLFDKLKAKQTQTLNNFSRDLRNELININVDLLANQQVNQQNIQSLTNENLSFKTELATLQAYREKANRETEQLKTRVGQRWTNPTIVKNVIKLLDKSGVTIPESVKSEFSADD